MRNLTANDLKELVRANGYYLTRSAAYVGMDYEDFRIEFIAKVGMNIIAFRNLDRFIPTPEPKPQRPYVPDNQDMQMDWANAPIAHQYGMRHRKELKTFPLDEGIRDSPPPGSTEPQSLPSRLSRAASATVSQLRPTGPYTER